MKNIINNKIILGIFALFIFLGIASCENYLDKAEESTISEKDAFEDFISFQGFNEELYNCIVNFSNNYWTNSWNWGEDEITSTSVDYHFVNKIDKGNFWGWQSEFDGWGSGWMDQGDFDTNNDRFNKDLWNSAWYGIRKANIGIANIGMLTNATDEERNLIKGQLLFFRAWFHFRLIQYFGGLPYIDYVLPSDEELKLPRLSYHECADKAAADFREAANLLPTNWDDTDAGKVTNGDNALRINKIMALGYLGKNYLWAGSPLMNQESTDNKSYNVDYCQKAASAFAELLQLCDSGEAPHKLLDFSEYSNNFYTESKNWALPGGTEAIFRGPVISANNSNWGTSKQFSPKIIGDGDAKFLPTSNYVDYYGMANGLPINNNFDATEADAKSGYNPEYPWRDRDPRFYNDIIFDGVKFVQGTTSDEDNRYANLYSGGTYRDVYNGSRSGYVLGKFIPITCNIYDKGWDWGNSLNIYVPYMRLADIYLMYAESVAQAYGSANSSANGYSLTAADAINVLRDRAGVGHVNDNYLGALDDFISEVRRERAVELSFEGHRFNDLRRWLLLTEKPYTMKKSVEFDRTGDFNAEDPSQNKVANIREEIILERELSSKHYWLPLKKSDVSLYPEFYQNKGW